MKLKFIFIALFVIVSCKQNEKKEDTTSNNKALSEVITKKDTLEIYDFNGVEKFLKQNDGKTYVVNFWATWCAPCVKELPHFEKLYETYKSKNVEVLLISLDFPHQYESKLKPFIKKNNLQSKVIALDDADMNTWIPKVDESWSGSLPATIIYKNDQKEFFEQSFTYNELEEQLKQFLN